MIGSIKGKVAELQNEYCLIETPGGVGYRVFMPSANLAALTMGSEVRVHTYTSVREDAILLFGFLQCAFNRHQRRWPQGCAGYFIGCKAG